MPEIRKVKVSKGIEWIEIPKADVYMLCGCPPDSVKHLMKLGLIVPTERDGWTFETGPNVILMSDVVLQNGSFTNMAEFPVLQILYKQGTLIPNHPNNTGVKPILIGAPDQIKSQMEYIYRGNYGLISEDELRATGISDEEAKELMRMKLRFAFGQILHPSSLIDERRLDEDPLEIKNGVFVKRTALNQFEVSFEGETASVDLNLGQSDRYATSYPLNYHNIDRDSFAIIHSGDGDGWDVDRPAMSSVIFYQGKIYLVDAGPNILSALEALGIGISEIDGLFHTHSHDDHFAGMPAFIRSDRKIKYYAAPYVRAAVAKKLSALLSINEARFEDFFDIYDLDVDEWNEIDGLEVRPRMSPHPVETTVLQFRALGPEGYRTYFHYADIVSLDILKGMITDDPDAPGISQKMFDEVQDHYLEAADIKKIDIGGGLIHGDAQDFAEDKSNKIILSHTSEELSPDQRKIGSGAPFGTKDILIPSFTDPIRRNAFDFLAKYFPTVPHHALRTLMNTQTVTFNPQSILVKEGDVVDHIYLILTGSVEMLKSTSDLNALVSAGSFVGEMSALHQLPAMETYRALNFIHAIQIPSRLYLAVVEKYDLFSDIVKLMKGREFLQSTWLFGESLSYTTQNKLAAALKVQKLKKHMTLTPQEYSGLVILRKGEALLKVGDQVMEPLKAGDFFGEDSLCNAAQSSYEMEAVTDIEFYELDWDLLNDIPVVQWKLIESDERRQHLVLPTPK